MKKAGTLARLSRRLSSGSFSGRKSGASVDEEDQAKESLKAIGDSIGSPRPSVRAAPDGEAAEVAGADAAPAVAPPPAVAADEPPKPAEAASEPSKSGYGDLVGGGSSLKDILAGLDVSLHEGVLQSRSTRGARCAWRHGDDDSGATAS